MHVVSCLGAGWAPESGTPQREGARPGAVEGGLGSGVGVAVADEECLAVGKLRVGPGLVAGVGEDAVCVGSGAVVENGVGRVGEVGDTQDRGDGAVEIGWEGEGGKEGDPEGEEEGQEKKHLGGGQWWPGKKEGDVQERIVGGVRKRADGWFWERARGGSYIGMIGTGRAG